MTTVTVPDGFIGVVVLIARGEEDADVKIVGLNDADSEHGVIADAIAALASEMSAITDELIEEAETPDPSEGEQE
jgi:hypothetical protein